MTNETVHTADFAKGRTHCCRWDDPEKLRGYDKHKFLELNNWNLQHPKYIEHIKNALNTSHKFCVHTRVGDFKSFGIESKLDFVNPAIAYVLNKLKVRKIRLGEDKDFIDSISYSKMDKSSTSVFVSRPLSRGDDLCLGMTYCDTLLITAPASSFAWWIGYLMPEGSSKVYYNSDLEAYGQLNTYEYDNFPSEWLPIRLAPDNNSIVVDEDAMKFHEKRNYNFPTH
ncbi:putative glycosyltransferase C06E1.7 [Ditylenchus destructor]|uniref:Glycosyltransferase C06E1.7 n=1 Tax=Ditylenchus destructor TaxID=166010 RepID=A0AAD4MNN9_9BILA|nr:putative glycosyltransferase C06E1.7 [Ditylenchus destructor]